jgi:hypothetical protein
MKAMRTRIITLFLMAGLVFSSVPAFAKGGYHPKRPKKTITPLGTQRRTGNKTGNAETAEAEKKIVDDPEATRYGNDIVDPPSTEETAKPKPKPKAKPKT